MPAHPIKSTLSTISDLSSNQTITQSCKYPNQTIQQSNESKTPSSTNQASNHHPFPIFKIRPDNNNMYGSIQVQPTLHPIITNHFPFLKSDQTRIKYMEASKFNQPSFQSSTISHF
jgi:hypothetical protein